MNNKIVTTAPRSWLNSLGAVVSITCAVQCAFLPLLLTTLPFSVLVSILPVISPRYLIGGGLEKSLLVASAVLAVGGFFWGFLHHGRVYVFLFLISAFALIFIGRMWIENPYQIPFIVSGSLLLAAGHVVNSRLCRALVDCHGPRTEPATSAAILKSSSA